MPRVLIVRGHQVTPWELAPWRELPERFEVSYLLTGSNRFAAPDGLRAVRVRALRDLLPPGPLGEVGALALGDRYISARESFASADVVHAEELSYWFAAEAARHKRRHGFALVQTVWETLPLLDAYRNRHARRHREFVLAQTDLFLAATARAANALRLEGVGDERIVVCPPGVDVARFAAAATPARAGSDEVATGAPVGARPREVAAGATGAPVVAAAAASGHAAPAAGARAAPVQHTIVSPGRLAWEKGHHDVLRALAALHRGIVTAPDGHAVASRLLIVGTGPEQERLRAHARELGIGDAVEIAGVPYERMPAVFAGASAMVLASLSSASGAYHPLGTPHAFWEEQFGMVLAEAMAAGLAIVASTSGAIPEVLAGAPVDLLAPGDWLGIARALAAGPLARAPGARVDYPQELVQRYSTGAAAQRLAAAYDRVLGA